MGADGYRAKLAQSLSRTIDRSLPLEGNVVIAAFLRRLFGRHPKRLHELSATSRIIFIALDQGRAKVRFP